MTVKKSADMPTSPPNPDNTIMGEAAILREMAALGFEEAAILREAATLEFGEPELPKLTDMTVDDLKSLIGEVVAAELQKWSNQSTTKDLNNSASNKLYINSEGNLILPERTPEEIARQAQSIRDMFIKWESEYDAEEQRETFAYLQQALSDDFPSQGSFSENPLSVSQ